jgi:hypothetical protein
LQHQSSPETSPNARRILPERAGCDTCVEIDRKIEHRLLASRLTDQPILDGIKQLIERMPAQKTWLHPDQEQ